MEATKTMTVMDARYIEEHDVLQRYLRHALDADELAAFEILLIANPAYIDQLETRRSLNESFRTEFATTGDSDLPLQLR